MSSIFIAVKSSYLPCRSTAPLVLPVKDGKVRVPDKNKTELELGRHGRMPAVTGLMQAPVFKSKEPKALSQRLFSIFG